MVHINIWGSFKDMWHSNIIVKIRMLVTYWYSLKEKQYTFKRNNIPLIEQNTSTISQFLASMSKL